MSDADFERAKPLVMGRQDHRCLRCGVWLRDGQWPGYAVHHRMNRRRADPEWRHSPANLVALCGTDNAIGCHGWVHRHPEEANRLGLYLRTGQDPRTTPVIDWRGRTLLLDDQGDYTTTTERTIP